MTKLLAVSSLLYAKASLSHLRPSGECMKQDSM